MAHGSKDYRKIARGNKRVQEQIYALGIDGYNQKEEQRKANAAARKKSKAKPNRYDWDD